MEKGSKKFDFPIFCAAWVPLAHLAPNPLEEQGGEEEEEAREQGWEPGPIAVLAGGGGEGQTGVPNALLLSRFEVQTLDLSDQPVFRLDTGGDVPYRMAVHPRGDGIICAFLEDCRWFEWNFSGKKVLALKSSEKKLTTLEGVGLQMALAFNAEGSTLATGGEDGHLRVFKWPSMEIILDQTDAHTNVKDLDFSSDAKSLVSLGYSGPCRVWDLTSSKVEVNLQREDGEVFVFCKFGQNADNTQVLYIAAMHGDHGKIITWNTESWKRIGAKRLNCDSITAFNVSTDGKLLAIGTAAGDILVLTSSNMRVQMMIRKAHSFVTAVVFSQDSRFLISASCHNFARVTPIEGKKKNGSSVWLIIFVILLAIMASRFMK